MSADKLDIIELLYRYAELIDAGDFDGVGALLSKASFGGTGPQGVSGADNIAKLFAATTRRYPDHGNTPRTRHLVLNPIVDLAGDTATSRSTFCVVQDTESVPIQPIVVGRYFDTFGRGPDVSDGWHFTERKVEIQMIGNVSDHLMVDPTNF
jgi:3-phenylpropionate/cinnamic acid dioxygenase small subunit